MYESMYEHTSGISLEPLYLGPTLGRETFAAMNYYKPLAAINMLPIMNYNAIC